MTDAATLKRRLALSPLSAQNRILRAALIQIINDPEMAVKFALRAIDDCDKIDEAYRD